jgi:hypothetical protein
MHDNGVIRMFNDGEKVIMDADTFIELVTYKVNFDKLVSDIQGATK